MHFALKILGYGLAIFSAVFFLVYAAIIFEGEEDRNIALVLMVLCAGPTAGGAYMVRAGQRRQDERRERQLLRLATERSGRLTAEEAAMVTNLNVDECRQRLDALCVQGAAQLHVTAEGVMEYTFSGLVVDPP